MSSPSLVGMVPYEVIEHTADIGIRGYGRSPEELFRHMAQGMFSLIVSLEEVRPRQAISLELQAKGWEELLRLWLRELLYRFETEQFLGKAVEFQKLEANHLKAKVAGEKLDPNRHVLEREVKAVTYCDFSLEQRPDGVWQAQVIFDI